MQKFYQDLNKVKLKQVLDGNIEYLFFIAYYLYHDLK
jgi:hypothetical protein